ncbi:hypothetical protein LX36DRAFT_220450 [Colletotrichum falcatum]|nr:hypothetical protein LX36DRAFT_220450 [Colletotrichum falcatum]
MHNDACVPDSLPPPAGWASPVCADLSAWPGLVWPGIIFNRFKRQSLLPPSPRWLFVLSSDHPSCPSSFILSFGSHTRKERERERENPLCFVTTLAHNPHRRRLTSDSNHHLLRLTFLGVRFVKLANLRPYPSKASKHFDQPTWPAWVYFCSSSKR